MIRIGLFFVPLLVVLNNCLSTLETARINKGFHFGGAMEVIHINSRYKPSTSGISDRTNYALTLKPCYGWKRSDYGAEIGLKLGCIFQSYTYATVVRNPQTGKYGLHYYPERGLPVLFPKFSLKVGFLQTQPLNLAFLGETILYTPSAVCALISWEREKYTPYVSLKAFRRFLSPADRTEEREWGVIFALGGEKRLNKGSLLLEAGLVRDYWLQDKLSGLLGLGVQF